MVLTYHKIGYTSIKLWYCVVKKKILIQKIVNYTSELHIRATHQKTNEVKFYKMTSNFEREDMNDQNCLPTTSEMILLVKKWFWYNKLKLEIDNDGIHTNEYLYGNTGFSWNTPAIIISAFYKTPINIVNTNKEKEYM